MDYQQLTKRQRAEILAADEQNLQRLADAYQATYAHMLGNIDALTLAIEKLDNPTAAQVKALPEFKRLERQARQELNRFTSFTEVTIETAALAAIGISLVHSQQWITLGGGATTGLTSQSMAALLSYLQKDSPLYQRLALLTGSTVDSVTQTIIQGVGLGYNPRKIASQIQDAFGGGLTDALRNTRTVQIWSYRDTARANYMASDGVVQGWIWWAELDGDTCPACIAMHGTLLPNDDPLDGHYNCRCTPIPYIEGLTNDVQSGQDWFDGLDDKTQQDIMGSGKWEAYKSNAFEFSQLAKQTENDVYGTMRVVPSLAELTGTE